MTDYQTVSDTKHQSARTRLDRVEDIVMGVVSYDVNEQTVAVDIGDADWFQDTAANARDLNNLKKNQADIDWARLTTSGGVNTIDLDAGRYKVTLQLVAVNTHATMAFNYRYAITDDAATPLWLMGVPIAGTLEPGSPTSTDNHQTVVNHIDFIELTDATNILYLCTALAAASQTGIQWDKGISKVIIERLG